jgi:serine/threonine protein kinase
MKMKCELIGLIHCVCRGSIYRASQNDSSVDVALKYFGYDRNPPSLEAIMTEIEIMRVLQGAHGATPFSGIYYDTIDGLMPGKCYKHIYPVIVMKYLAGGDIFAHVNNSILTEADVTSIVTEIVRAMIDTHSRGLIYRNLRLESVLFGEAGPLLSGGLFLVGASSMTKITLDQDFTTGTSLIGSPGSIAPESWLRKEYSRKSDIWQFGCLVYTLCSGLAAFPRDSKERAVSGSPFPTEGQEWEGVSDSAKDFATDALAAASSKSKPKKKKKGEDEVLPEDGLIRDVIHKYAKTALKR